MTSFFSCDHRFFYRNEQPFTPFFGNSSESSIQSIALPATMEGDLDWSRAREEALSAIEKGRLLLWEFSFGQEEGPLDLFDRARYNANLLAVERFLEELYAEFTAETFGASLYKGRGDISSRFVWSGAHENHLEESGLPEEVYCTGVLADYLHRLASSLPDGVLPLCFFDLSELPLLLALQSFSKERFTHLNLALKGSRIPFSSLIWKESGYYYHCEEAPLALMLPSDERLVGEVREECAQLLERLVEEGRGVRVIPESLLNEQWDGLDRVIALKAGVSALGKRMLQGFGAAGGEVIFA